MAWLAALAVAGRQIWLQPIDPLQMFRATVMVALFIIMVRMPEPDEPRLQGKIQLLVPLLILSGYVWVPGAALALAFLAWQRCGRWPAVIMALLILPWDPWLASEVQWPLQVVTGEIGGLLSGIAPHYEMGHPIHGDTIYLRVPCAAFCSIPHHNVAVGMTGYEPFRINEQCAGLNQVEGLFALTGAVLLLLGEKLRHKQDVIFLILAPVLAVVINGVRVAFSVWLGRFAGRGPWEGWLHDLPSYIVFAVAVFAMAVTARRLSERRA